MQLACAAFVFEKEKKKKKTLSFMYQFDCNIINLVRFQGIPQISLSVSVSQSRLIISQSMNTQHLITVFGNVSDYLVITRVKSIQSTCVEAWLRLFI